MSLWHRALPVLFSPRHGLIVIILRTVILLVTDEETEAQREK